MRLNNMSSMSELQHAVENNAGYVDYIPRGKWIAKSTGRTEVREEVVMPVYEFTCNQCGHTASDSSPFCPWCGADMRKGDAE